MLLKSLRMATLQRPNAILIKSSFHFSANNEKRSNPLIDPLMTEHIKNQEKLKYKYGENGGEP